MAFYKFI
jgi:outer membrane translocation and assembly module TamA